MLQHLASSSSARSQSTGRTLQRIRRLFQTPNIQRTVKEAARDATQTAAAPLIKTEVTREVQEHIRAEGPQIHAEVISETKKGVAEMQPQIDAEVNKQANAAETRIRGQISPLIPAVSLPFALHGFNPMNAPESWRAALPSACLRGSRNASFQPSPSQKSTAVSPVNAPEPTRPPK